MTKATYRRKGFIWLTHLGHGPSLMEVRVGTQAGTWSRSHGGMPLASSPTGSYFATFFIQPRTMCFRVMLPTNRLDHLAPANNQSIPHTCPKANLIWLIRWLRLPSQVTLGYIKLTVKANGDRRKGTNFAPNLCALLSEPMGSFSYGVTVSETWMWHHHSLWQSLNWPRSH